MKFSTYTVFAIVSIMHNSIYSVIHRCRKWGGGGLGKALAPPPEYTVKIIIIINNKQWLQIGKGTHNRFYCFCPKKKAADRGR